MDISLLSITVSSVLKLVLMAFAGVFAAKRGILDESGTSKASKLMLDIATPMMIIKGFFTTYDPSKLTEMLWCFLGSFLSIVVSIAISEILIKKKGNPDNAVEVCAASLSNCGAIGLPLATMIMGDEAAFYIASYLTVFMFFLWIYAPLKMSGKFDMKAVAKQLVSPSIIAICIGLIVFFSRITVPTIIQDAVTALSNCTTPLAMMVTGAMMYRVNIRNLVKNVKLYFVTVLKLIVCPLAYLLILKLTGMPYGPALSSFIAVACPTAAAIPVLAADNSLNEGYAAGITTLNTLLCSFSVPLMISIYSLF